MPDGTLEPLRCGASNRCDYCAMFAALEAALVLKLDAELCMPTVGITTTTRREGFSLADLRKAEQELWRALRSGRRVGTRGRRRRGEIQLEPFPLLRYCGFLEFTTGDGTRSGGYRRPHIHHLVKGIPADHPLLAPIMLDDEEIAKRYGKQVGDTTTALEQRVSELWRAITGDAFVVEARPLRTPVGAIAYLALHHHKKRQAPPPGFVGRRLRPSRVSKDRPGYYERPIAELREAAQDLAGHDRVVGAAKRAIGVELYGDEEPHEWDLDAQLTEAMVVALRDMAEHPSELQLDIDGVSVTSAERAELLSRVVAQFDQIRARKPPELVRVRERPIIDHDTGEVFHEAVLILAEDHEHDAFRPRVIT